MWKNIFTFDDDEIDDNDDDEIDDNDDDDNDDMYVGPVYFD